MGKYWKEAILQCNDIGMFPFDRDIQGSFSLGVDLVFLRKSLQKLADLAENRKISDRNDFP